MPRAEDVPCAFAQGELPDALIIDRTVLEWRLDPSNEHHIPEVMLALAAKEDDLDVGSAVVLADPEGNDFCILRSEAEVAEIAH